MDAVNMQRDIIRIAPSDKKKFTDAVSGEVR
jgi:hypothetical protein